MSVIDGIQIHNRPIMSQRSNHYTTLSVTLHVLWNYM